MLRRGSPAAPRGVLAERRAALSESGIAGESERGRRLQLHPSVALPRSCQDARATKRRTVTAAVPAPVAVPTRPSARTSRCRDFTRVENAAPTRPRSDSRSKNARHRPSPPRRRQAESKLVGTELSGQPRTAARGWGRAGTARPRRRRPARGSRGRGRAERARRTKLAAERGAAPRPRRQRLRPP